MKKPIFNLIKGLFLVQIFIVILMLGVSSNLYSSQNYKDIKSIKWERLLLPFSKLQLNNSQGALLIHETSFVLAAGDDNELISKAPWQQEIPLHMLASHIQALAYTNATIPVTAEPEGDDWADLEEDRQLFLDIEEEVVMENDNDEEIDLSAVSEKKVVFYCTHSAESYIPDAKTARQDGQRGLINKVGEKLAQELNQKGIRASFINTIHDYPNYNKSYTNSRQTVNTIIKEDKKNLLALFDVHRDSIPGLTKAETFEFKGKKAAKILIVVGTNERKAHPNWKKNLQFADKIYAQAQDMYPGLIKGIRTKAGTYNQEFFPESLLIEFGSDQNSLKEAEYAAELFVNVLIEVFKENYT